jgi:hypothetical protein
VNPAVLASVACPAANELSRFCIHQADSNCFRSRRAFA